MKEQKRKEVAESKDKNIYCIFFEGIMDKNITMLEVDGVKKSVT